MATEVVLQDSLTQVISNGTVTASGSWNGPTDFGNKEVSLFVNITAAPTGTTPSISFTVQELDPGDQTTPIGTAVTGAVLTGVGTQIITLPVTVGGTVQVSWTVNGTAPSFTGVYATLINKGTSPAIYDQAGNGPVAVKPASTAAVAADPALVVTLSPNSSVPAGTNTIGSVDVLAQYNTTPPAPTNSHTVNLQSDQSGNLLNFPGVQVKSGYAWGQSTPVNTVQYPTGTNVQGAPLGGQAVVVQLDQIFTFSAGAVTFQGTYDNGNTWVTIPQFQILNPQNLEQIPNPYTFQSNTNQAFLIILNGLQQVRMNLTTAIVSDGAIEIFWTVLAEVPFGTILSGTVSAYQAGPWTIEANQFGSWTVAATQSGLWTVQQGNAPWSVTGTVAVSGTTEVAGTVSVSGTTEVAGTVSIAGTTEVAGTVSISGTTEVAGTVSISGTTEVAGTVAVSGTTEVAGTVSVSSGTVSIAGTAEVAGTVTSNQGVSAPLSGAWPMELTDGTNGPVAVKPADTAAVATDASIVVALSPNSPIPPGTNSIGTVVATQATPANLQASVQGIAGGQPVAVTSVPTTANIYSVAVRALVPTSSNPTDLVTISGSATKTVRVQKIVFCANQSSSGTEEIDIVRRSSVNSGGTFTNPTPVYYDSTFPSATAVVTAYTANPSTLGTSVGNMEAVKLFVPTASSTAACQPFTFDFSQLGGITLRGTSQLLTVNWGNGASLPSGLSIECTIHWIEE